MAPHTAKNGGSSAAEGYRSESCSICTAWVRNMKWGTSCGGVKRRSTWRSLQRMSYAYLSTTTRDFTLTKLNLKIIISVQLHRNHRFNILLRWILQTVRKNKKYRKIRITYRSIHLLQHRQKKCWYHQFTRVIKFPLYRFLFLHQRSLYQSQYYRTWKQCL